MIYTANKLNQVNDKLLTTCTSNFCGVFKAYVNIGAFRLEKHPIEARQEVITCKCKYSLSV